TLNAISVYLGYPDWQAFKAAKQQPTPSPQPPKPQSPTHPVSPNPPAPAPNRRPSYPLIASGIILLIILALLSWNYFIKAPTDTGAATFTIRKTTQNTIPNTVVFTYDIDHIRGDSFFIQQSWDKHRRVRVDKGSHTLTDIYYEPGYHTAKLIANNKIIKTIGVSIPTDDWFFYSKESFSLGLPSYIRTPNPIRNGILGLEKQDLTGNRVDPEKPQVYLYTYFPTTLAADADNFRLDARIRMEEVRNTACPFIMPEIFCQHGLLYFEATMPGCTGSINAQFGDNFLDGKNTDLSSLAIDVHDWHHILLLVKQKHVTISIDGKPILAKDYTTTAGHITGLGFHSNGLCKVDSISLTGLDGTSVYPSSNLLH
ncbi:MAG TPA: hypothetical protein VNW04_23665, partial [Puia sp.]|nr:hypothetical protein [Puia sp.]